MGKGHAWGGGGVGTSMDVVRTSGGRRWGEGGKGDGGRGGR